MKTKCFYIVGCVVQRAHIMDIQTQTNVCVSVRGSDTFPKTRTPVYALTSVTIVPVCGS